MRIALACIPAGDELALPETSRVRQVAARYRRSRPLRRELCRGWMHSVFGSWVDFGVLLDIIPMGRWFRGNGFLVSENANGFPFAAFRIHRRHLPRIIGVTSPPGDHSDSVITGCRHDFDHAIARGEFR